MVLTKRPNGFYYVVYDQANGKRTGISTHTKIKSEALKFLTQFIKELETKRIKKVIPISLKEYRNQFLNYSKQIHTQKTYTAYKYSLSCMQKFFGEIYLTDISVSSLTNYFDARLSKSTIYMARKDLIVFNSFFNRAITEGYLAVNPCNGIKRYRIPQKQPKFFSELEFDLLLNAIKEHDIRDLVIFAIQTGLRQMELLTLEWSQINFKERVLILSNHTYLTKSKRIRTVPLSIRAMQILVGREKAKSSELVFTYNSKPINQNFLVFKFKTYVREAKINPGLSFHSLRHTFASWLVQRGVSIFHVSKLLGHSRVETTEIYSHLRAEDLRAAINSLNN